MSAAKASNHISREHLLCFLVTTYVSLSAGLYLHAIKDYEKKFLNNVNHHHIIILITTSADLIFTIS